MRWLGLFGIALTAFLGCSLEDALENAPCNDDDDCLGEYTCVRTAHQEATLDVGWCRPEGQCAPGVQEGCVSPSGTCQNFLTVATDPDSGNVYCCDANGVEPTVTNVSADFTSAQCVACDPNLCNGEEDATEECAVGEPRCVAVQGEVCGCRVPENQIENSDCNDASDCGEGFVCTRTLEQEAESSENEPLEENQAIQPGWCRPSDAPECVSGEQVGCSTTMNDGCPSPQTLTCTEAGRCYCCADPADTSSRVAHVYAETSAGESAACVDCRRDDCTNPGDTCTSLENPACQIVSGVCGCLPEA